MATRPASLPGVHTGAAMIRGCGRLLQERGKKKARLKRDCLVEASSFRHKAATTRVCGVLLVFEELTDSGASRTLELSRDVRDHALNLAEHILSINSMTRLYSQPLFHSIPSN